LLSKNTVEDHIGSALEELRVILEKRKGALLAIILLAAGIKIFF
jgi:hypothetical protein